MSQNLPPKMPDEWLKQIDATLKSKSEDGWRKAFLIPTLAAFLGSVFGAGSTLLVNMISKRNDETYSIRAEVRQKLIDVQLQRLNEKRKPYDDLQKSIRELRSTVATARDLALASNGSDERVAVLKQSFGPIEKLLAEIFAANKDDRINATVNSKVNVMCDTLDAAIMAASRDSKNIHAFGETAKNQTEPQLLEISQLIDKAIDGLLQSLEA